LVDIVPGSSNKSPYNGESSQSKGSDEQTDRQEIGRSSDAGSVGTSVQSGHHSTTIFDKSTITSSITSDHSQHQIISQYHQSINSGGVSDKPVSPTGSKQSVSSQTQQIHRTSTDSISSPHVVSGPIIKPFTPEQVQSGSPQSGHVESGALEGNVGSRSPNAGQTSQNTLSHIHSIGGSPLIPISVTNYGSNEPVSSVGNVAVLGHQQSTSMHVSPNINVVNLQPTYQLQLDFDAMLMIPDFDIPSTYDSQLPFQILQEKQQQTVDHQPAQPIQHQQQYNQNFQTQSSGVSALSGGEIISNQYQTSPTNEGMSSGVSNANQFPDSVSNTYNTIRQPLGSPQQPFTNTVNNLGGSPSFLSDATIIYDPVSSTDQNAIFDQSQQYIGQINYGASTSAQSGDNTYGYDTSNIVYYPPVEGYQTSSQDDPMNQPDNIQIIEVEEVSILPQHQPQSPSGEVENSLTAVEIQHAEIRGSSVSLLL